MKKTILMALALVASASFYTAEAAKKKKSVEPVAPVVEAVQLNNSSDSVSYAGGITLTNGLIPFLQQQGVDTAYMADFIQGFKEMVQANENPKTKAYAVGMDIARQVSTRMLPGMIKSFAGSPDSIVSAQFYRGFTDALAGDTTVFTMESAETYFQKKQKEDQAAKEELLYGRYDTTKMTATEVKSLIWRYYESYWNNRRICSAIGGMPPKVKLDRYYDSLQAVA